MKYQKSTPSDCKDKGMRKFELVAKSQFLCFYYIVFSTFSCGAGLGVVPLLFGVLAAELE